MEPRQGSAAFSRRAVVAGAAKVSMAGALAALARPGEAALAQGTAMPNIIQQWVTAYQSTDLATQVAALYTPDAVYEDVPTNTRSQGGDVHGFLAAFAKGVSDVKLTPMDAFSTSEWAALEYTFSATDRGLIPGGEGKSFSVRIATIFQLQGDKIARSSDYYDSATIASQLGLVPASGTPVATPVS
jgi:steroid delta-isomerase-like uncharacterized protein